MADQKIKIMGVHHVAQDLEKPLAKIVHLISKGMLDSHRPVGIELPVERIRFMEELHTRRKTPQTQKKQLRRLCEAELDRAGRVNKKAARALEAAPRKKMVDAMTEEALNQYAFWYPIYKTLRKAGISVVPVTTSSFLVRLGAEMIQQIHPSEMYSSLLRGPMQEEIMTQKITAEHVQLVLVGAGHANAVKEKLETAGIQSTIIFREREHGIDPLTQPTLAARSHYADAKRARRDRQIRKGIRLRSHQPK